MDNCQYRTIPIVDVPQVEFAEHGVKQIDVPWSEPKSPLTALFESLVINWLHEASIAVVVQQLNFSWDEVDTIMQQRLIVAWRVARRTVARMWRWMKSVPAWA